MNGYVHEKVPAELRTMVKLTYEMKDNELILNEERPAGQRHQWERMPIARFYWEETGGRCTLAMISTAGVRRTLLCHVSISRMRWSKWNVMNPGCFGANVIKQIMMRLVIELK